MTREEKIRMKLLSTSGRDNCGVCRKIKRQIRNLQKKIENTKND